MDSGQCLRSSNSRRPSASPDFFLTHLHNRLGDVGLGRRSASFFGTKLPGARVADDLLGSGHAEEPTHRAARLGGGSPLAAPGSSRELVSAVGEAVPVESRCSYSTRHLVSYLSLAQCLSSATGYVALDPAHPSPQPTAAAASQPVAVSLKFRVDDFASRTGYPIGVSDAADGRRVEHRGPIRSRHAESLRLSLRERVSHPGP